MTGDITTLPPSKFHSSQPYDIGIDNDRELSDADDDYSYDDEVKEGNDADMVPHKNVSHRTRSQNASYHHTPGSQVSHLESANMVTSTTSTDTAPAITLSLDGYKNRGRHVVDPRWYRQAARFATDPRTSGRL